MKFWNREKEKKWLKHYLLTEPNAILFVYGPKSSGKTTLLMKVVEELPKEKFIYYWFDLRERLITNYKDVVEVFFLDEEAAKEVIENERGIDTGIMSFFKISFKRKKLIEERRIDPFRYMADMMRKDLEEGKRPVVVFDELQKLKDIYLNGGSQRPLIKELFNFFVRLTKVLHLAHVIVMTSDTFFIEQIYTDSTLKNTSRFYLVDFFDDETVKNILISEGLSEKDASYIVKHIGGVPWMMEEIIKSKEYFKDTIQELFDESKSRLDLFLMNREEQKEYEKILSDILSNRFKLSRENIDAVKDMVESEILFYDPVKGRVKFHTKLDELAAKELLGVE